MSLSSALSWAGPIEKLVCLGIRSKDPLRARLTEAESAARRERLAMSQREPMSTLSGIIMEAGGDLRNPLPIEFAPKVSADVERKRSWQSDSSGFNNAPKGGQKGQKGDDRTALFDIEQKPLARIKRMAELAQNTGFVEESYGGRSCLRPVEFHNSHKPNGCARGDSCRYGRNDYELRLVKELTRVGRKVRPEEIRNSRVTNLPNVGGSPASAHLQPWGMGENEIPAFRAEEQTVSTCETQQSSISRGNFGVDYETNNPPPKGRNLIDLQKEPRPFPNPPGSPFRR